MALLLPLLAPLPPDVVPFQRDQLCLLDSTAWRLARLRLAAALEARELTRATLQAALAAATDADTAWLALRASLLSMPELELYDVPSSRPQFRWSRFSSASLEFEAAALAYTRVALHQRLALVARGEGDCARALANAGAARDLAEYVVACIAPGQAVLPPADTTRHVPPLLAAHFWHECVAPLVAELELAEPVRDPLADACRGAQAAALVLRALAAAPASLVSDGERRDARTNAESSRATAYSCVAAALVEHAIASGPRGARFLPAAAWLAEHSNAPTTLARCTGALRASSTGAVCQRTPIAELEEGSAWQLDAGGVLIVPVASLHLIARDDAAPL